MRSSQILRGQWSVQTLGKRVRLSSVEQFDFLASADTNVSVCICSRRFLSWNLTESAVLVTEVAKKHGVSSCVWVLAPRCASYFQLSSRYLDVGWNTLSCLIYFMKVVSYCLIADPPLLDFSYPRNHTVVERGNLTLQCKVTASNPRPTITWYNGTANSTGFSYGSNLTLTNILRVHTGRYYCVADNGIVSSAAVSGIGNVDVQCK